MLTMLKEKAGMRILGDILLDRDTTLCVDVFRFEKKYSLKAIFGDH
jgi:hypothetical protein